MGIIYLYVAGYLELLMDKEGLAMAVSGHAKRGQRHMGKERKDKEQAKEQIKARVYAHKKSLADMVMKFLDNGGEAKWTAGWDREYVGRISAPWNACTKWRYTRGNMFLLKLHMYLNSWGDPRFVTYRQVINNKVQTTDGKPLRFKHNPETPSGRQRGLPIFIPMWIDGGESKKKAAEVVENEEERADEQKETSSQSRLVFKAVTVFNAQQFENFPKFEIDKDYRVSWRDWSLIDDFIKTSGIKVTHAAALRYPHYSVNKNEIFMYPPKMFKTSEEYYATLLHEWYHATGHKSREDRLDAIVKKKDPEAYAIEELRSEIFTILVSTSLGLSMPSDADEKTNRNLNYIKHWVNNIPDESKRVGVIFKCFEDASKMMELFTSYLFDQDPKVEWFPPREQWIRDSRKIDVQIPPSSLYVKDAGMESKMREEEKERGANKGELVLDR